MTFARLRFVVVLALFLGWLGWLAVAVMQKDRAAVLSRAQLANASCIVVAEVQLNPEGLPDVKAKVKRVIRGAKAPAVGETIEVANLREARNPLGTDTVAGDYLLSLVDKGKFYTIALLPASPGMEERYGNGMRPTIFDWNEATERQLRSLGLLKE